MRILWLSLAFPFLLVLLAWGLFPYYLPPVAKHFAAQEELALDRIDVSRPGLSGWIIYDAVAKLPDGTVLEAANIHLYWDAATLSLRRLTRIDVGALDISPVGADAADARSTLVPTVIPAYLLEQLPVDAWSIAALRVHVGLSADIELHEIQSVANGNRSRISIFSRARTSSGTYLSWLEAQPGIRHEWQLRSAADGHPLLHLVERRPDPGGYRTEGHAQVEAGRLTALLRSLGLALPGAADNLSGQLRLHWQGTLPPHIDSAQPLAGLVMNGQAETELDYRAQDQGAARLDTALSFSIADGLLNWNMAPETRLRVRHPELLQLAQVHLGVISRDVWAELTTAAPLAGDWQWSRQQGTLRGALHLELHGGEKLLGFHRLRLQEAMIGAEDIQGVLHSTGSLQPQDTSQSPYRELGWDLQSRVTANRQQIEVSPGMAGSLRVQTTAPANGPTLPKTTFKVLSDKALRVNLEDGRLSWDRLRVTAGASLTTLLQPFLSDVGLTVQGDAPQLTLRDLRFDPEHGLHTRAELNLANLQGASDCCRAGPLQASITARLDATGASGAFQLKDNQQTMVLQSDWRADIAAERLEGTLAVLPGLTFPAGQKRLTALLSPWSEKLEILAGAHRLDGSYWFERAEGFNADLHWQGTDWRVRREEVQASGVSFESRPEIRASGIGLGQYVHFHVRQLDAGFPIEHIRGDLWVRIPLRESDAPVLVRHFSAELLGGRVSADVIPLPVGMEDVRFTLNVEGIDLAALLRLEQRDDLSGSGRLDGDIPFRWTTGGISVDRGRLAARAPGGFLRFTPDAGTRAMAKTQPSLNVAIRALENFRYNLLEAGLDYREDGQLLVRLKIHGENPELHGGHPVHLNISVEENVLTLLKSLQYSDEISGRIGKQFQKGD